MTTAQSRSGRHALISADEPAAHGDEVDPTAVTAAFAAVPRPAGAPSYPPPAAAQFTAAQFPATPSPAAAPSAAAVPDRAVAASYPAAFSQATAAPSYPMPYGPPHAGDPFPAVSVPAQRTPVDSAVPPPPPGHWPQRAERPGAVPAPRRRRVWPFVVAGVLILLLIVGIVGANGASTPAATTTPAPAAPAPAAGAPAVPAAEVPAAQAPAAPVEPAGPSTTVGDGRYEVGVDMAAGKYKTTGPGSDSFAGMCYQARSKDDSGELGSIISNDIVQGPSVMTVKDGEVVDLSGGCQWTRQ